MKLKQFRCFVSVLFQNVRTFEIKREIEYCFISVLFHDVRRALLTCCSE